jgi:hypothetical protein
MDYLLSDEAQMTDGSTVSPLTRVNCQERSQPFRRRFLMWHDVSISAKRDTRVSRRGSTRNRRKSIPTPHRIRVFIHSSSTFAILSTRFAHFGPGVGWFDPRFRLPLVTEPFVGLAELAF